jgi:hypothetical protein
MTMRLRTYFLVVAAMLLGTPVPTPAAEITLSVDAFFISGLGRCYDPADLTPPPFDPARPACDFNPPPANNADGGYDQVRLIAIVDMPFTIGVPGTHTFTQDAVFIPNDTGGGSVGYIESFDLSRFVTVTEGTTSVSHMITQTGTLEVGFDADLLTILDSLPQEFELPSGTLTLTIGGRSVLAGTDPNFELDGVMNITNEPTSVPIPSTLALFALGLVGLAIKRSPVA